MSSRRCSWSDAADADDDLVSRRNSAADSIIAMIMMIDVMADIITTQLNVHLLLILLSSSSIE